MTSYENPIVRPVEGVVFRRLQTGKGGVLLKLDSGAYHSVNETGAVLWELMGLGRPLLDVTAEFLTFLDTHPPRLDDEVRGFFDQLKRRGMVEIDEAQDRDGPFGP